jgi:hypothetical protein
MDISPASIAVLLTAGGAPIAAAIIQQIISFMRDQLSIGFVAGREKLTAFAAAIVIVAAAAFVGLNETPPRYDVGGNLDGFLFIIGLALAVYNIGRLAMAIYDDRTNDSTASVRNTSGWRRQENITVSTEDVAE